MSYRCAVLARLTLVATLGASSPFSAALVHAADADCRALEQRPPNAAGQRPESPDQTRACASPSGVAFEVVVLARDLDHPWSVEPLPNGDLLVTERAGRLRRITPGGAVGPPIQGLPAVDARGQGGLLDVALSPAFATDRTIFWSYSEARGAGNATSVARGELSADGSRVEKVRVIFRAEPAYEGDKHFGSRVVVGPDGALYVTLGERSDRGMRSQAQQLDSHMGKIVRIGPDGSVPQDNPYRGQPGARPEIWSQGHRNVQAGAFDSSGQLWIVEHGTQGGDELNRIVRGGNYGWPVQAYGEEYAGVPIAGAATERPGMESPVYYWDPVIAPSGAEFYDGTAFPQWRGSLFVGALKETRLVRLEMRNGRVAGEEHLLAERGQRIRDVREGPDGALYVVTDEGPGEVWKITPRVPASGR